jgi:hypothetical protein
VTFTPPLTVLEFRDRFPEFGDGVEDALISKFLELAANNVSPEEYGTHAHDAAYYFAADKLALSPFGGMARVASANGTTTYGVTFQQLQQANCFSPVLVR